MSASMIIALIAAIASPAVTLFVSKAMDKQKHEDQERAQSVALAVLTEKVDAIPEKMNGKIIKAITKHANLCPYARNPTNPAIPRFDSDILE